MSQFIDAKVNPCKVLCKWCTGTVNTFVYDSPEGLRSLTRGLFHELVAKNKRGGRSFFLVVGLSIFVATKIWNNRTLSTVQYFLLCNFS